MDQPKKKATIEDVRESTKGKGVAGELLWILAETAEDLVSETKRLEGSPEARIYTMRALQRVHDRLGVRIQTLLAATLAPLPDDEEGDQC